MKIVNMENAAQEEVFFMYTGLSSQSIPRNNVTHIKVDPSVKAILPAAFSDCTQLKSVNLCEGIERIDQYAFSGCISLEQIRIPSSIKVIGKWAFKCCRLLRIVELCEGIERIDEGAFLGCKSLEQIRIPSTIKVIGKRAFWNCTQLRIVELCEGIERIDEGAFLDCKSLEQIRIPSSIKVIDKRAFWNCRRLRIVELCEGIERIDEGAFSGCISLAQIRIPSTIKGIHTWAFKPCSGFCFVKFHLLSEELENFVSEVSLTNWWHAGITDCDLSNYFLLTRWNLPKRFGAMVVGKMNMHDMLSRIPSIASQDLDVYIDTMNLELANYEQIQECVTAMLDHAIKCGADVIVPQVLSFL